jgi:hypothetical protein
MLKLLYMKRVKEEAEGTVVAKVFGRAVQSVIPCLQSVAANTSSLFDNFPDPERAK